MNKQINKEQLFKKLEKACRKKDSYSLAIACEKIDVSYAQIKEWSQDNPKWTHLLQYCKTSCCANAEIAGLKRKITFEEALMYMTEDCDSPYCNSLFEEI